MTDIETRLIERLKQLPPGRVAEVVDFVEFLATREERATAAARLGEAMAKLDALNLAPLSEEEVEQEVQASRQVRRQSV
jgi:anti-sigma factor RsiW